MIRAAWRAAPALLVLALAGWFLTERVVGVPAAHVGTVADGFTGGRWDAPHRVARGDLALRPPSDAARVVLSVSGAGLLHTAAGATALTAEPAEVEVPAGALRADGLLRLHRVSVERSEAVSWWRWAALVGAAFGALVLLRRPGSPAVLAALASCAAVAALVLQGTIAGLAVRLAGARLYAPMAMLVLAALILLPLAFTRRPAAAPPSGRLAQAFGAAMLLSSAAQVLLVTQPLAIGDPGAYLDIGNRVRDALAGARSLDTLDQALRVLRPYGGLYATAGAYGLLRAVSDSLVPIYLAHAAAMGGAIVFLVRAASRLGGLPVARIVGVLALAYAPFAVICGIVQPEPFILCCWCFALDRLLLAAAAESPRDAAWAGLAFAAGLALHPQGIWVLLAALALAAVPFLRALARPGARALALAFVCGMLPFVAMTWAGERAARPAVAALEERHGFWAYTAPVPLGFWLYLETSGWQGPLRLDQTEYGRGFLAAEAAGTIRGASDRLAYTTRFVAARAALSLQTVLRNLHRLFRMPDNPPLTPWPLPHAVQVALQGAVMVLFVLAVPLLWRGVSTVALAPVVLIAATYPLYHVYNKYALPATPFLLLGAALALDHVWRSPRRAALVALLAITALACWTPPAALALQGLPPLASRVMLLSVGVTGLLLLTGLAALRWATSSAARAGAVLAAAAMLAAIAAAEVGNPGWGRYAVGADRAPRHELSLGADSAALAGASDARLLLDLHLPDGDPSVLTLRFDTGLVVPGASLRPGMPPFGIATVRERRRPETVRQWWDVPWQPAMAHEGRVGLTIEGPGSVRVFGDLGAPRDAGVHRGLSLGEWPFISVYRLMHEGEYRLPTDQPLAGARRSSVAGRDLPGSLGVRLVVAEPHPAVHGGVSHRSAWRPLLVF